jgi:aryl-phospho-beta-D-glucosidase BglC (GH1 family)
MIGMRSHPSDTLRLRRPLHAVFQVKELQGHPFGKNDLWQFARQQGMTRRRFLAVLSAGGAAAVISSCLPFLTKPTVTPAPTAVILPTPTPVSTPAPPPPPPSLGALPYATYAQLPRWRGFNLLEKCPNSSAVNDAPYQQADLDFMVEFGFNFVRLPLDYKIWTAAPGVYREAPLKEIDDCISWARARGIHVCLDLHRVPGYWVSDSASHDLWDATPAGGEARRQFAEQWELFAKRYRGIPPSELSFNLVNEPPQIAPAQYVRALLPAILAIRNQDPERLIIADGIYWGALPVKELAPYHVAQSIHQYEPMPLTHYNLSWIEDATEWPVPTWPIPVVVNKYLFGSTAHPNYHSPLVLLGTFQSGSKLSIHIKQVSTHVDLRIRADGVTVLKKVLNPGPSDPECISYTYQPQWFNYIGEYDLDLSAVLPNSTKEIRVEVLSGDYLTFSEILISPYPGSASNAVSIRPSSNVWGTRQTTLIVDSQGNLQNGDGSIRYDKNTLINDLAAPWSSFSERYHTGIHVSEMGVGGQTPHPVALAWLKDLLEMWKDADVGWALWNLRGEFGVLNSGRRDVEYEDYKGLQLDRKMLELLRQN